MIYRQMTGLEATYARYGREDHQVSSDWFGNILGRLNWKNRNTEFVCKKYHDCMLSTNVNQYLAFRPPQRTRWVYEWGAQDRKYKISKKPPLEEAIIQQKTHNRPINYDQVPERY
jgi:hypothetical protein